MFKSFTAACCGALLMFGVAEGMPTHSGTGALERPKGESQPINYGHVGAWFNTATPGQGFLIDIIPGSQFMFVPWFTFDTISPQDGGTFPGAEQRWFTAQGNYNGNRAELVISASLGGAFDAADAVDTFPIGTMVIEFTSCTSATLSYDFPDIGLFGSIPISKLLADELCTRINDGDVVVEEPTATPVAALSKGSQPINYGLVGGWFNQSTPGQGFMFDFLRESNFMFVAWFTFDAAGSKGTADQLRWLTAQGSFSGNSATLEVSQTRNGVFDDPTMVDTRAVGTMTVSFDSCTSGSVVYDLPAFSQAGAFDITKLLGDSICSRINSGELDFEGGSGGTMGTRVTGTLTYDRVPFGPGAAGLDYCSIVREPARDIVMQAIDAADGATLATTSTDASGGYSLDLPDNRDVFLRVLAAMVRTGEPSWDFRVVDNTNGQALYALNSATFNSGTGETPLSLNAASGFTGDCNAVGASAYDGFRAAGPFAILDGVYQSYRKVLDVDPTRQFRPLLINWSVNNVPAGGDRTMGQIGTSFYDGELFILGADGVDSDEYDEKVVIHEWGHYFEDTQSRSDSIGGPHSNGDILDPRVAFGEGFGNALSGIVTDDPIYKDSLGAGNTTLGLLEDLESNVITNPGFYSEGSVQSILYDLYDATNEPGDNVTLGFGPLYQVLRNGQRQTPVFTTIFSFIDALKSAVPGQAGVIDALVGNQTIAVVADPFGSAETNNAGSPDVLPVYTQAFPDGVPVRVCSIDSFGGGNKLSTRRFVDFQIAEAAQYTISVAPVSGSSGDAAFFLFRQGTRLDVVDGFLPGGTESLSRQLDPGAYVIEALEFENAFGQGAGRNCFDVAIARN